LDLLPCNIDIKITESLYFESFFHSAQSCDDEHHSAFYKNYFATLLSVRSILWKI